MLSRIYFESRKVAEYRMAQEKKKFPSHIIVEVKADH